VIAVAEVEAHDVDARLERRPQLVTIVKRRTERGHDLGLPHDVTTVLSGSWGMWDLSIVTYRCRCLRLYRDLPLSLLEVLLDVAFGALLRLEYGR
jgi:hypothetical protein